VAIPFRFSSSSQTINNRHDLLVFAFEERKPDVGEVPALLNDIDNNLPPRDPNLVEFIGRREYLVTLWSWLNLPMHTAPYSYSPSAVCTAPHLVEGAKFPSDHCRLPTGLTLGAANVGTTDFD
jgi:hypothetical protein